MRADSSKKLPVASFFITARRRHCGVISRLTSRSNFISVHINLDHIVRDLGVEHQEPRGRAMQSLLSLARKDRSVWVVALPHFERALTTAPDS
ncbi:MAG: hypothetical protein ABJC26_08200 [Gemmatimonadaceae bacterium]